MTDKQRIEEKALRVLELISKNPSLITEAKVEPYKGNIVPSCVEKFYLDFWILEGDDERAFRIINDVYINYENGLSGEKKYHYLLSISTGDEVDYYDTAKIPSYIYEPIFERCKELIEERENELTEHGEETLDDIIEKISEKI